MTGEVFGRLTVIGPSDERQRGERLWQCRCECGATRLLLLHALRKGRIKSCGCLKIDSAKAICKDLAKKHCTTHGMAYSPEYKSWNGMWQRCTNPKAKSYELYKDRVPPTEWKDFSQFLRDVGSRPSLAHTLERVDNNKAYGPGNTIWALPEVQHKNTSANRWIEFKGEKMIVADWAKRIGISRGAMSARIAKWPIDRALTAPKSVTHNDAAIAKARAVPGVCNGR